MSQMAFYFDGTRCTGCKTCQMACKDYKDLDVGAAFRRVYEVTLGDTTRDANGVVNTTCVSYPLSESCNHCDSPACFAACPQAAIAKDPDTGLVTIDDEKCIGDGACTQACPYGVPKLNDAAKKSYKCDGCAERVAAGEKPICVEACPARALDFGPAEDMAKLGERAAIAPLPDPATTNPNFFILASADAQPAGKAEAVNPLEVV